MKYIFKFIQSRFNNFLSQFKNPAEIFEKQITEFKKDFDETISAAKEIKKLTIKNRKDLESKTKIVFDLEQKFQEYNKKSAKNRNLDDLENKIPEISSKKDRLITEIEHLKLKSEEYNGLLEQIDNKILEMKDKIKNFENQYTILNARFSAAKASKNLYCQLSRIKLFIDDLKIKIQDEENLLQANEEIQ